MFSSVEYAPLGYQERGNYKKHKKWVWYTGAGILVVGSFIAVVYHFAGEDDTSLNLRRFRQQFFPNAAVSADAAPCARHGKEVLDEGGSAVDAVITALLCNGLSNAHSMGIGGGFVMTIWDGVTKTAHALIAREWAPLAATEDMFGGNGTLSVTGGLAVAVPGEIMGYWEAHQKFGKLNWTRLFQPAIQMCEEGMVVQKPLADAMKSKRREIRDEPTLREIFWNEETNNVYELGDTIKRPVLAVTLKKIAQHGADELYQGITGAKLVEDIQKFGGIISMADLKAYKAKWYTPFSVRINSLNLDLHTTPAPSSGPLMGFILNVVESFGTPNDSKPFSEWNASDRITTAQRIIEAFKHTYGKRTLMGDPEFLQDNALFQEMLRNITSEGFADYVKGLIRDNMTFSDPDYYGADLYSPDDHGTAHVSVTSADGSAVAATSTINLYFGAKIRSPLTGIILNDEMDDFSAPNITNAFGIPPSPNNFIKPQKRPLSSMCPAVFVDRTTQEVRLVTGAAGGTKITTAVAWVSMLNLMFSETLMDSTAAARFHHQLFPMEITAEKNFPEDILLGMRMIGHKVNGSEGFASVVSIAKTPQGWNPVFDPRKIGEVAGN
ncbi:unnamed protein product [Notodromas monacha]|uniref:Gamma-glutamyltransferase n=1 Tax=Notodromas monacha TaxID=399045 RepID=A0A7R9BF47_9CRUS|nr:unnamed protein product [Notodromas monacha]CAG0913347.1 unnamed protein product [Notodromas monacha]